MDLVVVVALLALLEYFAMGVLVGRARARSGIAAPAITGDPVFERTMRAHQNTLEQLIVFLPALFAFAHYVQPTIAAGVGALFIVGRAIYFRGYVADAPKRAPGSLVSAACQAVLLLGGLIGAVVQLV